MTDKAEEMAREIAIELVEYCGWQTTAKSIEQATEAILNYGDLRAKEMRDEAMKICKTHNRPERMTKSIQASVIIALNNVANEIAKLGKEAKDG